VPRKISPIQKEDWFKKYRDGVPVHDIAKMAKRGVRTVKRGIEEVRREVDARSAHAELLKDTLLRHQHKLLTTVEDVFSALEMPDSESPISTDRNDNPVPIVFRGANATYETDVGWNITLNAEEKPHWDLLRQHMARDPFWKRLKEWKEDLSMHLEARLELQRKATLLLKDETGLKVELSEKPHIHPDAVKVLYQSAVEWALNKKESRALKKEITILSDEQIFLGEIFLAKADVGKGNECREAILRTESKLRGSPGALKFGNTYKRAMDSSTKSRKAIDEIRMLGLVPGQCKVCRRLGL